MQANSLLAKAVRFALISSAGLATVAVGAANAAGEDGNSSNVERIQVTGSRIQRTDLEGANPVTVFSANDIERTGVSTVADFLRTNVAAGGFNESSTLSQAAGASSVGLRGFSSDFTLILLNGHRLPKNSAGGIFTDINQIPLAAVQRIDILPDGASAIYGSDAVAGVINIITKKDFEGVAVSAKYGAALRHRDGVEKVLSVVGGASNDKTNVLVTAEHFQRGSISAQDRELGNTAFIKGKEGGDSRSSFGIPGFSTIEGTTDPTDSGTQPWADCPEENRASSGACLYDFAPLYQLQPESVRQSIFSQIIHHVTDEFTLTGQLRYTRANTQTSNAPAPGIVDVSRLANLRDDNGNLIPMADNSLYKFLRDDRYAGDEAKAADVFNQIRAGTATIDVGRRYLDFPNRQKDNTNDTFEAVADANYELNDDWGIDFTLGHSRLTNRQIGASGQLLRDQLEDAFNNGSLNPFALNDCSSTENRSTCDALQAAIHRTGEYSVNYSTFVLNGLTDLELPGGQIGIATGADWRNENYSDRSDPASVDGQVIGGAGSNGGGGFTNYAGFVELSIPILDELELDLAGRYDKAKWGLSDDSESTYSSKISYRPIEGLLLRASYGTGFKAPNLADLFTAVSEGVTRARDTRGCQERGVSFSDCPLTEINSQSGGNPNLTSETSKSFNMGAVYQFTDEISASLDYWSLEVDNIVGSLSTQEILNQEARGNENIASLVHRDVNGRVDSASEGFVQSNLQNLNEQKATGLEYNINYGTEIKSGDFKANMRIEQFLSFESQESASQPLCDSIKDDAARKYRLNADVSYGFGDYDVGLNMRFLPGYNQYEQRNTFESTCQLLGYYDVSTQTDVNGVTTVTNPGRPQHVASYLQLDLTSTYHFMADNSVTFGIRNILDRQPSFSTPYDWPFYNQGVYDNIGRFAYLQLDSKF